ncbi:MAG TPA: Glu/Leu/Phe/Val dehydrogenase dimerization domain-containing protein [Solirubrobacteraceae bacterium]|jgi:leucine dehydrogenase|nr:Glu/Leu/Phe/Val dehydrogenase dimerization domain-containing protein [Solirubrobacteraceae bacterium]
MSATAEHQVLLSDYEDVRVRRGRRSGLTMAVAVHRTVDGRSLGGCRMRAYATADEAVRDAERLARAMTLKAAVAGLPLGGAKGVIAVEAGARLVNSRRSDALRDFAELVESFGGRYITAQDVGTCEADIAYMSQFTEHVGGRPVAAGGCGDPSQYTAHGVEVAIRASLGGDSIAGRQIVVVGLGHVGGDLARRLHQDGAELTVADIDSAKRRFARQLGARWVSPEEALELEADLLAPCALGGVLDRRAVERLQVPIVAGAANNQLAHEVVAEQLAARGIVWAPDFVVNAGGLIAVAEELHGFNRLHVERAIAGIGDTLREIYARAEDGTNTLIAAQELAAERTHTGGSDGDDV